LYLTIKKKRKSPDGNATNDLIFSAHNANNAEVFRLILGLYVPHGSKIADVTYGQGTFWKNVDKSIYNIYPSDIKTGIDCKNLPYENETCDCIVLDPPYMHTPGGTAHVNHQNFENYYRNNSITNNEKKYHDAVLDSYFKAAREACRVLKKKGVFILKCQDEVCANKQRLTHVELINELSKYGYLCEDLFVIIRNNKPGVSRILKQRHARKNHSYFLVFRKIKIVISL
jgi:tRNA G10  N-methylase Trm11